MPRKPGLLKRLRRAISIFIDPIRFKQQRVISSKTAPLRQKIEWDALPRTHFAYGLRNAALQARALGIDKISAVEFGCAGGNGLIELEQLAIEVLREVGVEVDVYGFDIAVGLPKPVDYRDLPYVWKAGQFKMDIDALRARLATARLVVGDVAMTVPKFCQENDFAPIGFISFDLDYYSSTTHALKILTAGHHKVLPRVYCYFDDIIGPDHELHSEFAGELLAIKEFNSKHELLKVAPINGLKNKRIFPAAWNDSMFVSHSFSHPLYCVYIGDQFEFDYSLSLS